MATSYKLHLLVFAFIWSFILVAYFSGIRSSLTPAFIDVKTNKSTSPRNPFIYLIQTENCLPAQLAAHLRNASTSNIGVLILSFRKPCARKEEYGPHISYMFDPNTTWSSGRNVLYFAALDRTPGYLYYIFLDDDIQVKFNAFTPSEMASSRQPLRAFEDWLLDYEPAVGVLVYESRFNFNNWRAQCGRKNVPIAIQVVHYDALFNAFHYKASLHMLPYRIEYERESWWNSQRNILVVGEIKFRGQALMFTAVTVYNLKHRSYPRQLSIISAAYVMRQWINETRQLTPSKYKDDGLFQQMMLDPEKYFTRGRMICLDTIKHKPIIPYAHFGEDRLDSIRSNSTVPN